MLNINIELIENMGDKKYKLDFLFHTKHVIV